jgi:selenobiotic family peptide radical SAM maturase
MVRLTGHVTDNNAKQAASCGCGGFTLQWHLTNRCGYNCTHCYDRTVRNELGLPQALDVLAGLEEFCGQCGRKAHVCFTGGDPLLYPDFWQLYEEAAARGIPTSILGNPIGPETIGRLMAIQRPLYYQVSLEGLQQRNDAVRGDSHFSTVMAFLLDARRMRLTTHVMLTLTRENVDDIIPLGEELRGLTSRFTFNRLAQVGRADGMPSLDKASLVGLLKRYLVAARTNPVLGFKDNLFNIVRHHFGRDLLPGCTGSGCGAAASFVALLPDGQVHACRKYPSPIGDVLRESLGQIYSSGAAAAYRRGSARCRDCAVRSACGGCQAVTFGRGLDPLKDRDPDCFFDECAEHLAGF